MPSPSPEFSPVFTAPAFQIDIPFPIYPKARPRFSRKPCLAYMPQAYIDCVHNIGLLLKSEMPKDWNIFSSYKLVGTFYLDSSNQGDVDQLIGTIMDAGNKIVWHDDRQIAELLVAKFMCCDVRHRAIVVVHESPIPTGFEPTDATIKAAVKAGSKEAVKELARRQAANGKARRDTKKATK